MILSYILAMDANRAIGYQNQLPWHLPADLAHFKHLTLNKPIIMGRKTYESIGRPLPNRTNIIITHDRHFTADGCEIFHDIDSALAAFSDAPEIMIIGGASLFEQCRSRVQRLYLTIIRETFLGDTYFPEFDLSRWQLVSQVDHQPDIKNPHAYSFYQYDQP